MNKLSVAIQLGFSLAQRDISAQYRQTFLGLLWAIFPPLVTSLTFIFLSMIGVVRVEGLDIPYPLFVFTGTIFWQMFSDSILEPQKSMEINKSMLSKIDFPREAIIIEAFCTLGFNMLIKLIILLVIYLLFGVTLTNTTILFILPMLGFVAFGLFLGVLLIPIGTLYKDIQNGVPIILSAMIFFCPVLYQPPNEGLISYIYSYNPITFYLESIRELIYGQGEVEWFFIFISILIPLSLLYCATLIFKITMPHLIERMEA